MGKYIGNGTLAALSTSYKTSLALIGGTGVRPKLHYFEASLATAADEMFEYLMQRLTGTGTATSVTPKPVDPADPAAECTLASNHSAEPAYTSGDNLPGGTMHQRGVAKWQAYDDEARIVVPASSNNGVGLQLKIATGTPAGRTRFEWAE